MPLDNTACAHNFKKAAVGDTCPVTAPPTRMGSSKQLWTAAGAGLGWAPLASTAGLCHKPQQNCSSSPGLSERRAPHTDLHQVSWTYTRTRMHAYTQNTPTRTCMLGRLTLGSPGGKQRLNIARTTAESKFGGGTMAARSSAAPAACVAPVLFASAAASAAAQALCDMAEGTARAQWDMRRAVTAARGTHCCAACSVMGSEGTITQVHKMRRQHARANQARTSLAQTHAHTRAHAAVTCSAHPTRSKCTPAAPCSMPPCRPLAPPPPAPAAPPQLPPAAPHAVRTLLASAAAAPEARAGWGQRFQLHCHCGPRHSGHYAAVSAPERQAGGWRHWRPGRWAQVPRCPTEVGSRVYGLALQKE